ncbi:MAG: hypothetical protein RL226_2373 [Bacteroidota bacterium]|jgi:hypothetical protein
MRALCFVISFTWISLCSSAQWFQPALSGAELRADALLLKEVLRESHAGLYAYTQPAAFEELFAAFEGDDSVSYHQAFHLLSQVVDGVRDGHTWIVPSDAQTRFILERERFIPFSLALSGQKLTIYGNFSAHPGLKSGTEVVEINGISIRDMVRELLPYVTADGINLSGKLAAMNEQFWWYYGLHFGFPAEHQVVVRDERGRLDSISVPAITMNDRIQAIYEVYPKYSDSRDAFSWKFDGSTAYLRIPRFSGMKLNTFEQWIDRFFQEVAQHKCSDLVIDLRGNGGGIEGYENILLSYLNTLPIERYNAVYMSNPRSSYYKHLHKGGLRWLEDWVYAAIEFDQTEDGRWLRRERFKRTKFCPSNTFDGPVYIWVDGDVFSGASEFASIARSHVENCTLIGQPTCGGQAGHTSGYYYLLKLPNTGFSVNIPRVRFDLAIKTKRTGGGLMPDVLIESNVWEEKDPLQVFQQAMRAQWTTNERN